jgi:hypothetical protein
MNVKGVKLWGFGVDVTGSGSCLMAGVGTSIRIICRGWCSASSPTSNTHKDSILNHALYIYNI